MVMNELILRCGPECPLFDLKKHECKLSGKVKNARTSCEFDYNIENAENLKKHRPYNTTKIVLVKKDE